MNARAVRILIVLGGMALAASLAVGQAVGAPGPAGHHGRLPGIVRGTAMIVTPAAGHAGPGQAIPPLVLEIHGRDQAGQPLTATSGPTGYGAAQLQAYLGLHGDGTGQTVAITDAFDDPAIVSDVNTYSQQFGLPQVCGTAGAGSECFHFTVQAPDGTAGTDNSWGLEMALDVEMVHALAPQATVVLVEAHDSSLPALLSAIDHAAALAPVVISNSWGLRNTEFTGETAFDSHCRLTHSLCVFSSGDNSNPAGYPAPSPDVLAIGGTTLSLASDGTVISETAWGCADCFTGSGGGSSYIEPRPSYQHKVNPSGFRGVPDVSFDADPATGVAVFDSDGIPGQWLQVGGTSVGAPAWSAILAVAGQLRAQAGEPPLAATHFAAQRAIYSVRTGLADITQGQTGPLTPSSGDGGVACGPQCQAGPGYDYVTGLGSPRPGIDTALAAAP
jgi:subtilase family serine protease